MKKRNWDEDSDRDSDDESSDSLDGGEVKEKNEDDKDLLKVEENNEKLPDIGINNQNSKTSVDTYNEKP